MTQFAIAFTRLWPGTSQAPGSVRVDAGSRLGERLSRRDGEGRPRGDGCELVNWERGRRAVRCTGAHDL